jgi:hypothetical protein
MIAAPKPSPVAGLAGRILLLDGALTPGMLRRYRRESPWPGCWCGKSRLDPVHGRRRPS